MKLDRAGIEQLVPQAGRMCLLDKVDECEPSFIACSCDALDDGHPLARRGVLPAIAGCEYAAQATALHGALADGASGPRAGMLAKLMDVQFHQPAFAQGAQRVAVRAELVSRMDAGCLYAFEVAQGGARVVSGRLIVAFQPGTST